MTPWPRAGLEVSYLQLTKIIRICTVSTIHGWVSTANKGAWVDVIGF